MAGILSVQFEPLINNIEGNLEKVQNFIENFIQKNPDKMVDLAALPEFFATGVSKNYTDFPVSKDGGKPVEFLSKLAQKHSINIIAGTLVVQRDEKLYNTMFVLDKNGKTIAKYDKIHLFKYFGGTEDKKITPGKYPPVVVDLGFAKVGLSICFDIKYPLMYRKLAQMGAEIVISPSAWAYVKSIKGQKETNTGVFRALNVARATENLVYFVSSNQAGKASDGLCNIGHSMIVSPYGEILNEAGDGDETIFYDIDLNLVRELKTSIPAAFEE